MSDKIAVKVVKRGGGNWTAECTRDGIIEMGRNVDTALAKMQIHFFDSHPGKTIYAQIGD